MKVIGAFIKNITKCGYEKTTDFLKDKKESIENNIEKIIEEELDEKTIILNKK